MEVYALTKYARMSPKKVREVARVIKGRPSSEAMELLRYIPRKSAALIRSTLQSAIANAENNFNLSGDDLLVKNCIVNEGPTFKRFQPVARGSAHPIRKRTSHIKVILEEA